jgi:tripartite-type tricarboxylate transporter receptor subunit TctC
MEKRSGRLLVYVCLVMAMLGTAFITANAQPAGPTPVEFYRGKNIEYIVPFPPGGSQDLTARALGPYLQKHTGATAVVIKNVTGGGGIAGVNHNYAAKADGLHIGSFPIGVVTSQLFEDPAIKYDVTKMSIVGGLMEMPLVVCVSTTGRFQSLKDLKAGKGVKFGQDNVSGHWSMGAYTAIDLMGLDAKLITGFRGAAPIKLALDRGEVDATSWEWAAAGLYMAQGTIKPLVVLGVKDRYPLLPDVPTLREVVGTTKIKPQQELLLNLWDKLPAIAIISGPPGIPKERLEFLQEAFKKTIAEPEVIKDLEKMARSRTIISRSARELKERFSALLEREAEIKVMFEELIKRYTKTL